MLTVCYLITNLYKNKDHQEFGGLSFQMVYELDKAIHFTNITFVSIKHVIRTLRNY